MIWLIMRTVNWQNVSALLRTLKNTSYFARKVIHAPKFFFDLVYLKVDSSQVFALQSERGDRTNI